MPKQEPNIRWRKSDTQKLQRLVKNFNAKLTRLAKKDPDNAKYLPERLSMKKIRSEITTRKDFNEAVSDFSLFTKRGQEEMLHSESKRTGLQITKWEYNYYNKRREKAEKIKREIYEELGDKEVLQAGKATGNKRKEMGKIRENELKPSKADFLNKTSKEWELAKRAIDKMLNADARLERQLTMRENYLKGLRESGILDAMPELEEIINELDPKTFYETTQIDETATFDFYKDPQAFQTLVENISNSWYTAYAKQKGYEWRPE